MVVPKPIEEIGSKLGISQPLTHIGQLAAYKDYLTVVNSFLGHFRKAGLPKGNRIPRAVACSTGSPFLPSVRRYAGVQALAQLRSLRPFITSSDRNAMRTMPAAEQRAYMQEKEEESLEAMLRAYAKPSLTVWVGEKACRVSI